MFRSENIILPNKKYVARIFYFLLFPYSDGDSDHSALTSPLICDLRHGPLLPTLA